MPKKDYGPCNSYYEIFEVLCENGYFDKSNLPMYQKMIGMRNKLVHEYEQISKEILYSVMKNNLTDFHVFKEEIKKMI